VEKKLLNLGYIRSKEMMNICFIKVKFVLDKIQFLGIVGLVKKDYVITILSSH
jgi:hypothetical protein